MPLLPEKATFVGNYIGDATQMKLSYRGVSYEEQPSTLEVTEGEIGGKYRGQIWNIHRPKQSSRRPMFRELIYRGITYRV